MNIKTSLTLLVSCYLINVILNSLKSNGNYGHNPIPFFILAILFLIYSGLSIYITTKLYKLGSFSWMFANNKLVVASLVVGLLAILYTVFTAIMIKMDWSTYKYQSVSNPKDFLAFTSYVWLPLLMIIPMAAYIYFGKTPQSLLFKLPLIINVIIGISLYSYFNFNFLKYKATTSESEESYYIQQTLQKIKNAKEVKDYLYFARPGNEKKLVDAVWIKINSNPSFGNELAVALSSCKNDEYYEVYYFLSSYFMDKNKALESGFLSSLDCIKNLLNDYNNEPGVVGDHVRVIPVEAILGAIDKQYYDNVLPFSKKMDEIQKVLEKMTREELKKEAEIKIQLIEEWKITYQEKISQ